MKGVLAAQNHVRTVTKYLPSGVFSSCFSHYRALGPTLAAMCELKRKPAQKLQKEQQSKRSLSDNGEMVVTLPPRLRFQAVGLAYLSVKL